MEHVCKFCGAPFRARRSRIYCSRACSDLDGRRERSVDAKGYVRLRMPEHHKANSWGFVWEHVVVAEQKIGRPLKDGEEVHHRNLNPSDNGPDNLQVFASHAEHQAEHARMRIVAAGGNPDTERICSVCKAIKSKRAFGPNSIRGKPTLSTACRPCHRARERKRWKEKEHAA